MGRSSSSLFAPCKTFGRSSCRWQHWWDRQGGRGFLKTTESTRPPSFRAASSSGLHFILEIKTCLKYIGGKISKLNIRGVGDMLDGCLLILMTKIVLRRSPVSHSPNLYIFVCSEKIYFY